MKYLDLGVTGIIMLFISCKCHPLKGDDSKVEFITTLEKNTDTISRDDSLRCQTWTLEEKDIIEIMKNMKQVSSTEQYSRCYTYPCYYTAKVKYKGIEYKMVINAASHIELIGSKENLFFILEDKDNNFLIPCNCCGD
jgi:hypothetical protein